MFKPGYQKVPEIIPCLLSIKDGVTASCHSKTNLPSPFGHKINGVVALTGLNCINLKLHILK